MKLLFTVLFNKSLVYVYRCACAYAHKINEWIPKTSDVILFYIPIYIQQDATLHSLFYLETALPDPSGTSSHHQEVKNCIYSIWY